MSERYWKQRRPPLWRGVLRWTGIVVLLVVILSIMIFVIIWPL